MIFSYITTSAHNIARHKLFSAINILGLAVSMSVGLLMILLVYDLVSYDSFHEKSDRIYRLISSVHSDNQSTTDYASSSIRAARKIKHSVTGIEEVTIIRNGAGGNASIGDENSLVSLGALYADSSFLNVFSFPLLQGDRSSCLKEPYSMVLTEKAAKKLFADKSAFGQSVKIEATSFTVTGVLKDLPKLSHLHFEALVSFATAELIAGETRDFMDWKSIDMNYTYVVLEEGKSPEDIQVGLDKVSDNEETAESNTGITLALQPLTKIVLGRYVTNQLGPVMPSFAVWILGALALVVIISAAFNYTSLSIARSFRRTREVGIRKMSGASRRSVFSQFLAESVIVSLLSLVVAIGLFLLLRPQFLGLNDFLSNLLSLSLSIKVVFWFILFAVAVGCLAGIVPALFFSRINVSQVLKDSTGLRLFHKVNLRKALIVVQYIFSLTFITTTIIGYKQYKSFVEYDLGFSTDNILNINLQGNNSDRLMNELSKIPQITGMSQSVMVTSLGSTYSDMVRYQNLDDSASVWQNIVDEHYLPLHDHKFIAGRNFAAWGSGEEKEVIVTELLLKRFNIGDKNPENAIGEILNVGKKKLTIVGVIKDFNYETVEDQKEPVIFRQITDNSGEFVNAKITSNDLPSTLATVQAAWKKVDKVHPMVAIFYDDQIEQVYSPFSAMVKVIGFLAFLTICLASMGLLGMVVFTTEIKLKEVSIRKVLGASEEGLVLLLSKGFVFLLAISAAIALPATYFFFENIVLVNFAHHKPIDIVDLLISLSVVVSLAFLIIGLHTMRTARTNPASVLGRD